MTDPEAALERFVERREIEVQQRSDEVIENICKALSELQFADLLREYRYAGQVTINFFVITGISDYELEAVDGKCQDEIEDEEALEGVPRVPFLADSDIFDGRLYLSCGYNETTGGEDPATGRRTHDFVQKRVIAVIHGKSDLVQIRASDATMARRSLGLIGDALGISGPNTIYRPNLNMNFQKKFGEELVRKYFNLRIRVDDEEGSTIDNIQFTAKKDETGERQDALEDERVNRELEEHGGEITMGYVELEEGSRFHINRKESRLSFQRYETESKLTEITGVIHDVRMQKAKLRIDTHPISLPSIEQKLKR